LTSHISRLLDRLFADVRSFLTFGGLGRQFEDPIDDGLKNANICDPRESLRFFEVLTMGQLSERHEDFLFPNWRRFIPRVASYLDQEKLTDVFCNIFQVKADFVVPVVGGVDDEAADVLGEDSVEQKLLDTKVKKSSRKSKDSPIEVILEFNTEF
jgi:hypothetical protein